MVQSPLRPPSSLSSRFVRFAHAAAFALALCSPNAVLAADYTDIWWTPGESRWGTNVVQSENVMFVTFFIYGVDRKPTWYTAQLSLDNTGAFSGPLYLTASTYYALPWNTGDATSAQQVGSASFRPSTSNTYQATLTYAINGAGAVIKSIERQTLTTITIGGLYTGGMSASQTGCNDSSNNGSYTGTYGLQVTQTSAGAVTLLFSYPTYACTMTGTLAQHGGQYTITGASYACTQSGSPVFSSIADLFEVKATAQGIEGRWNSSVGSGCFERGQFSAVLN
jgi:hypothetical protein